MNSVDAAASLLERMAELIEGKPRIPVELQSLCQENLGVSEWLGLVLSTLNADKAALNESAHHNEELKLQTLNLEQQLRNIDNQRRIEKEQIADAQLKLSQSNQIISVLETEKNQALAELASTKASLEALSNENELVKSRFDRLEAEKVELGRIINRKQIELDELSKQVESLSDRSKELREEALKSETALIEANGRISSLNLQLSLSQQQVDRLRQQSEWSAGELETALAELASLRRQRQGELTELQSNLEIQSAECEKLSRMLDSLQTASALKDERCDRLAQELLTAQERLAEETCTFEAEMDAKSRLVELYRTASEEATARLATLESKSLFHETKEARDNEAESQEPSSQPMALRSQAYEQVAEMREEMAGLQKENEQLRKCLEDVCKDLEDRVPQLQHERQQMERLKGDVAALSDQLLEAGRAREAALMDLEEARRSKDKMAAENRTLAIQVRDLGRQVQVLLSELEGVAAVPINDNSTVALESEQIIQGRLVTFRSIQELQVRNQELLRVVRELSAAQEAVEVEHTKSQDSDLRHQLAEAQQELAELHESRKRQSAMVEGLVRQRDMLRDLVASIKKEDGGRTENGIVEDVNIQESIAEPKEALTEASRKRQRRQTEVYLESSLEETRTALGHARSQLAKAQAQVDFGNERFETLQQNYQQQNEELSELKKRHSHTVASIITVQSQMSQLVTDLMSSREREQKASSQLSSMKVELQIVQTSETRLRTEVEQLAVDRDRLSRLLTNLQTMMNENEATDAETKQRLSRQIDLLEGELRIARKRLEEESEAHRTVAAGMERDFREMITKYEQLVESTSRSSEELGKVRLENSQLLSRIRDLETLLATNEERLQRLLTVSSTDEPIDMARELGACRMQIANLEDSIKLKEQHVAEYRKIASEAENALQDLTKTYDQYRKTFEESSAKSQRKLDEQHRQIEEVCHERDELAQKLADLDQSFAQARHEWAAQRSALEHRLGELQELEEQMKQVSGLKIEDVSRIKELVDEANQRYQDELIAHGRDLESLQRLRGELAQTKESLTGMLTELSTVRTNAGLSQFQWQREREALQNRHAELEKSFGELRTQNDLLLRQLESLSAARLKRDELVVGENTGEESKDSAADSSELVQVIRYLRRQKDIIQLEHETLVNEHRRSKIQLEQTTKALDEARAQLEEERNGAEWRETMKKEYEALLGKVEQLNLLRESNVTLRHETESLIRQVSTLEGRLEESIKRQEPLERERRELHAQVSMLKEQQAELKRDRDEWKRRLNELVEETGQRESSAAIQAEVDQLKTQLAESESTKQALEGSLSKLQAELEALHEKLQGADQKEKRIILRATQLRARNDELTKRVSELEASASQKEDEGTVCKLQEELTNCRTTVGSLEEQIGERDLRISKLTETIQKLRLLSERFTSLRSEHAECAVKLDQAVQAVQQDGAQRLEALRKEYELRFKALNTLRSPVAEPASNPVVNAPEVVRKIEEVPNLQPPPPAEPVVEEVVEEEAFSAQEDFQQNNNNTEEEDVNEEYQEDPNYEEEEDLLDDDEGNEINFDYYDEDEPASAADRDEEHEDTAHGWTEVGTGEAEDTNLHQSNLMEDDEMIIRHDEDDYVDHLPEAENTDNLQETDNVPIANNASNAITDIVQSEQPTAIVTKKATVSFTPAPITLAPSHGFAQSSSAPQPASAAPTNPPHPPQIIRRVVNLSTSSPNIGASPTSPAQAATSAMQEKGKKVSGTIDLSQTGRRVIPMEAGSPAAAKILLPTATTTIQRGNSSSRRGGRGGAGGHRTRGGLAGRGGRGGHVPSGESPF